MIKINVNKTNEMNSNKENETDQSNTNFKTTIKNKDDHSYLSNVFKIFKNVPTSSFTKIFIQNFVKFYGIRVLLELMKKLLKHQLKIFKYSFSKILRIFFNRDNLRTGLFLTLMTGLYKIFYSVLKNFTMAGEKSREEDGSNRESEKFTDMLITFISGFIASFIGIFFAEKAEIMNFVVLSIMIRSLHSMIVVYLKNNGYPTSNRFVAWLIFTIACFGVLFLFFYHPTYKPITKIVDRFALYHGNEKAELNYFKTLVAK